MNEIRLEYKTVFGKYHIPETLSKLIDYEEHYGSETKHTVKVSISVQT